MATTAALTSRSKSAVVEMLAEESVRTRRFPGIAFRGENGRRRAWVIGTGLDVWQIIEAHRDADESAERLVETSDLTERQVRLALAYADDYRDEIERFLEENRMPLDRLGSLYPFVAITGLPDTA